MSDIPPRGAAPGGGHNWLPRAMQRSRTPGAASNIDQNDDGTNDGGNDDATTTPLTPKRRDRERGEEHGDPPMDMESQWARLEAQYEKEQYERRCPPPRFVSTNMFSATSGYAAAASSQTRNLNVGSTLATFLNQLNLAQKGKSSARLVPAMVPSGVDPKTPADNAWRIQEIASGPGVLGGPVGHDRFPNVQPRINPAEPWHNPNLLQQMETLQGAMMKKKDPTEQIPAVYNSCILAMLEAFRKMLIRCRTADAQIVEMNKTREKEIADINLTREKELEQFKGMSEEWIQREDGYRAEIKRLELLLAKESKDGVASVAMARSNSLVDRSDTKRFQARLKRMSGSTQEGTEEQDDNEGLELLGAPGGTTYFRTLADIPQRFDANQDVLMSRLVEKREKEDKERRELEAFMQSRAGARNTAKDNTGYQKQTSGRHAGQQVTTVGQDKLREAQTLGPVSEQNRLVDAALNDIDDGLTVGREGNRSDATVTTGSRQPAALSSTRREGGPTQSGHGRGRRYSFSRGDDEVLPTPSLLTASLREAESRRAAGVPASTSSTTGLEDTSEVYAGSQSAGLPLSTSTGSTGSVVWLGGSGTLGAGHPENPDHPSGYTNSPPRSAEDGNHEYRVPAFVFTPEQARDRPQDLELSGSVVYSPMGLTETSSARYTRDGTGSPSASVSAMSALSPDTSQGKKSSFRRTIASPPPAFAPASTTTPPGALSNLSPSKVAAKTSETASGKAVTGDGEHN